jgi:PKD repeat protein
MKYLFTPFFLLCFLAAVSQQNNIIPGDFIVRLNKSAQIQNLLKQASDAGIENLIPKRELSKQYGIWLLHAEGGNNSEILRILKNLSTVRLAQYNHKVQLRATEPNDPSFNQQWSLKNTGQSNGTVGADIDATLAWDITTGGLTALGDTIVVAVIDGGYQMNHPDLVQNYFVNYHEIPGNGLDDDQNGYIDDVSGWDAYSDDGTIPSDQHGTHVSGIIGAKGDNTIGVAGVNWNVKILPIAGSSGNEDVVVAAYAYAAAMRQLYNETNGEKGAFVVSTNSSFGVDQGDPGDYPIWCAFYDDLGELGILSAGATANANFNIDQTGDIPTACVSEFLIAVTNSTRNDAKANGAAFGIESIDIAAPGSAVYSTITNSNYGNLTGTSMATPHVAGSIALMYAAACDVLIQDYKSNPASLSLQMKNYLYQGAEQIAAFDGLVANSRRLNLYGALQQVQTYICATDVPPVANFNASGRSGCPGISVNFNNLSSSNAGSFLWTFPGGSPVSSTLEDPVVSYGDFGNYNVTLVVTNEFGSDTTTLTNYVSVTNTGTKVVFAEDFEANNLSSSGFSVDNPDGLNTWQISATAGNGTSDFSLGINMFNNQNNEGQRDYIISPAFSLAQTSSNTLQLKYAHRRRVTSQLDSLIVSISPDNGSTWYRLDAKGGGSNSDNPLATNVLLTSSFVPASADDWCIGSECLNLDISAWDGASQVKIRLEAFNDAGNNIYVDDLVVSGICTEPIIEPVQASFSLGFQSYCAGTPVQFGNTSQNAVNFSWTFEGGNPATSSEASPSVTYSETGTFDVTLIAWNSSFSDTIFSPEIVNIAQVPPTPVIQVQDNVLSTSSQGIIQWFFNAEPLPGANSNSLIVNETGDYYVTATQNGCSSASEPYYFSLSGLTEIYSTDAALYPNPSGNWVKVLAKTSLDLNYQIMDNTGRLVLSGKIGHEQPISLKELAQGLYFIRVFNSQLNKTLPLVKN